MTRKDISSLQHIAVKLCVSSIRHQRWLAGQVRIYIYGASCLIAFLALAGIITLKTAILSIFCGGVIILALLWGLIQQRRTVLLNIQDPDLRQQAY